MVILDVRSGAPLGELAFGGPGPQLDWAAFRPVQRAEDLPHFANAFKHQAAEEAAQKAAEQAGQAAERAETAAGKIPECKQAAELAAKAKTHATEAAAAAQQAALTLTL